MNKFLMMTVASLAATAATAGWASAPKPVSPADAKSGSVQLNTGGCDVFTISWQGDLYAYNDDFKPCGTSSVMIGMGVASTTKGIGRNVALSDYYVGDIVAGFYESWDFQLPFKSGKKMCIYYTTNGMAVTEVECTTYKIKK